MEMIQRIARAVSEEGCAANWDHALSIARLVLRTMKSPSHAMCVAGDPDRFAPGDSEAIWETMIDTAMIEQNHFPTPSPMRQDEA